MIKKRNKSREKTNHDDFNIIDLIDDAAKNIENIGYLKKFFNNQANEQYFKMAHEYMILNYETSNSENVFLIMLFMYYKGIGVKSNINTAYAYAMKIGLLYNISVGSQFVESLINYYYRIQNFCAIQLLIDFVPENFNNVYYRGIINLHGYGVDINYIDAIQNFEKAANMGSSLAYISLGEMYHKGIGVELDYGMALDYYVKAYASGAPNSRSMLTQLSKEISSSFIEKNLLIEELEDKIIELS